MLTQLSSPKWIMANLLYGSGLRLSECLRQRVKDLDFEYSQITVRNSKGNKDRVTMLPEILKEPLQKQLEKVKRLHKEDLRKGYGEVHIGKLVRAAGGRWNAKSQVWEIPYGEVMDLGLEKRLVKTKN